MGKESSIQETGEENQPLLEEQKEKPRHRVSWEYGLLDSSGWDGDKTPEPEDHFLSFQLIIKPKAQNNV